MKRIVIVFCLAFPFSLITYVATAYGQDCTALLSHGLRNIRVKKSAEAATAAKYNQFCKSEYDDLSEAVRANVDVDVIGYGGGSASASLDRKRSILKTWCAENKDLAQRNQQSYEEVQDIYGDALKAWTRCNDLKAQKVEIEPKITPDAKIVDISLRYTGPSSSGVQYMGSVASGFMCTETYPTPTGSKPASKDGTTEIGSQAIKIRCIRDRADTIIKDGTSFSFLKAANVTVRTAGDDLQLYFADEWVPSLPDQQATILRAKLDELDKNLQILRDSQVPVGTIVGSYLDPELFYSVTKSNENSPGGIWSKDNSKWSPADGRDVSNSKFASISGKTAVPDLRGMFLRGLNYSEPTRIRTDQYADPEPNRQLGSPQMDTFQIHGHEHELGDTGPDVPNGTFRGVRGTGSRQSGRVLGPTAVNKDEPRFEKETRPKNVAIYYYIRIN